MCPDEADRLERIVQKKLNEERELSRKQEKEWYASFADRDLVNGGKYNLCKIEDIRKVFGNEARIQMIRDVISELRWIECFKYFLSGYSQNEVCLITGLSKAVVSTAYKHYAGLKNYPIYESEDFYMKKIDLTNVKEAGESRRPAAGAYICAIRKVEDVAEKEYLRVSYDIIQGEFKGYYDQLRAEHPDWASAGSYVKSYKPKALPMFKRFCSAVSKSNGNYVFDGGSANADERTLVGKQLGLVLREEEYYSNDGEKRIRLIVDKEFPVDRLNDQKVPPIKRLPEEADQVASSDSFINVPDGVDEIPFN